MSFQFSEILVTSNPKGTFWTCQIGKVASMSHSEFDAVCRAWRAAYGSCEGLDEFLRWREAMAGKRNKGISRIYEECQEVCELLPMLDDLDGVHSGEAR